MAERNRLSKVGDGSVRGIYTLLVGVVFFSLQDVVIKSFSDRLPVFEIMFLRGIFSLPALLFLVHRSGGVGTLKTRRIGAHLLRSVTLLLSYAFYYLAMAALPLADAVALFFSSPIFITLFSIVFLKEWVPMDRWLAILSGGLGVVIMLRPGAGMVDPAALLSILAAVAYAACMLVTRKLGDTESGAVMAFHTMVVMLVFSGILGALMGDGRFYGEGHASMRFFTRAWVMPTGSEFFLLIAISFGAAMGLFCITEAYRITRSSTVAPFEFSAMVPAVFWGFLIWGEVPGIHTMTGMTLIIGGGIYMLRREARQARA